MRLSIRLTPKWWYWLATAAPLGAALAGWGAGLALAFAAVCAQVVHFVVRTGSVSALSVQAPAVFLGLLALGTLPPLGLLHGLQLAGISIRLLFDYCLLARTLSLAPWYRDEPLSWQLVKRAYFTPPVAGSILDRAPLAAASQPFPKRRAS